MPLRNIYNYDFSKMSNADNFSTKFFARTLTLPKLKIIHDYIQRSKITFAGHNIPSAIYLKSNTENNTNPFVVLAQLHGNEPAGLAGIALAITLSQAKLLKRDVIGIIGNPLAAKQYFEAFIKNPESPQETRDVFRCGLNDKGELLPDGNRIPIDFMTRNDGSAHIKRARELYSMAQHISGILDIHSARGNMTCITDHKNDNDLRYSPIRSILTELAEAISAHASANVTVRTLKTTLSHLTNITCQTGIEAGRHEAANSPHMAAAFTLATFFNQGITDVKPLNMEENGIFECYNVRPRITYSDLSCDGKIQSDDKIYMAREHNGVIENYQYDEMQAIKKGQVVAVARPSGVVLRAPYDFSGIFFSKSAVLYDKDPSVGPWPVTSEQISSIKFCYPCIVASKKLL